MGVMALNDSPQVIVRPRRRRPRPLSQVLMGCMNKETSCASKVVRCSSKGDILDPEWQFVKQYPADYCAQQPEEEELPRSTSSSFAVSGFNMMKQRSKSLINMFTSRKHIASKSIERNKEINSSKVINYSVRQTPPSVTSNDTLAQRRRPSVNKVSPLSSEPQSWSTQSSSSSSSTSYDKSLCKSRSQVKLSSNCSRSSEFSSNSRIAIPYMDESPQMRRRATAVSQDLTKNKIYQRTETPREPLYTSTPKRLNIKHINDVAPHVEEPYRPRSKSYTRQFERNTQIGINQNPYLCKHRSTSQRKCKNGLDPSLDFYGLVLENSTSKNIMNSNLSIETVRVVHNYYADPTRTSVNNSSSNSCDKILNNKFSYNLSPVLPSSQDCVNIDLKNTKIKPVPPVRRDSLNTKHGEKILCRRNNVPRCKRRPKSCGDILGGQKIIDSQQKIIGESRDQISKQNIPSSLEYNIPLENNLSCRGLQRDGFTVKSSSSILNNVNKFDYTSKKKYSWETDEYGFIAISSTNHDSRIRNSSSVLRADYQKVNLDTKFYSDSKDCCYLSQPSVVSVSYFNNENSIVTCNDDETISEGSIYRRGARRWRKHYKINGHIFQPRRFNRKASCTFCKDRIWGLGRQGFKCTQCKLLVHKKCSKVQQIPCNGDLNTSCDTLTSHGSSRGGSNGGLYISNDYPQEGTETGMTEESSVETPSDIKVNSASTGAVTSGNNNACQYSLDDFELIRVIGRGSYAKVLMVELKRTKRIYAMKVIKKTLVADDEDIDWVQTEKHVFETASNHPFLVGLHSCFQTASRLFFVIEFVRGGDLMFHMQRQRRLPEEHARFYAAEICLALNFLHEKGIIYRDLKLDNVLLDHEGHIKLTDYGMCKEGIRPRDTTSTFCGTPNYIAPEILQGEEYSFSVDWWALGVLLYEMLAGKSPFDIVGASENPDCNTEDFLFQVILERPIRIPRSLSVKAASILKGFLNKNPVDRLGCHLETGFTDIVTHMFFKSIDWEMLQQRQVTPPHRPRLENDRDLANFPPEFTDEPIQLTPDAPHEIDNLDQTEFEGFEYVNPLLMSMEDCV